MDKMAAWHQERAAELRMIAQRVGDTAAREELMTLVSQWEALADRRRNMNCAP